jgi:phosphatidylserine decarboxylase
MNRKYVVEFVDRIPQAVVSRMWGWLARRKHPKVAIHLLKSTFVKATGINMQEAADPAIGAYPCLEDLFVRTLKQGARRIEPDPTALVSPVDGRVGSAGTVENGTMFQVKGRSYKLSDLLYDDEEAKRYEGGPYVTLYLSPKDYHLIHAPAAGVVSEASLIPGALMPVFPEALERVDALFARNERLITYLDSADAGRLAVVKVGATLVGRISVPYDSDLQTNRKGQSQQVYKYDPAHLIQKGAHLGSFELGSTVVLVGEKGRVTLEGLTEGAAVRMGQRIGTIQERKAGRSSRSGFSAG